MGDDLGDVGLSPLPDGLGLLPSLVQEGLPLGGDALALLCEPALIFGLERLIGFFHAGGGLFPGSGYGRPLPFLRLLDDLLRLASASLI